MLIELAFIRLTKPAMEENYDSILQRLQEIEDKLEDGRLFSNLTISNGTVSAGETENTGTVQGALAGGEKGTAASREPAKQVSIPKAQLDDLNLVRNEWGKIIRELGGSIRASFRNTVVEPSGESCLCIVFSSAENYAIGSRATVLGEIERFVEENYGKSIYFKARLAGGGERFDTVYVSEEELKANIHMDITIED